MKQMCVQAGPRGGTAKVAIAGRMLLGFAACLALGGAAERPATITGAGSTFVEPVMSRWLADYDAGGRQGGAPKIVYQAVGSGAGIERIKARLVDFGASDKPLPPEELAKDGLAQFPVVIGGVVPVVNLHGVGPGDLHLTGPVLADIYLGRIRRWNDPAIARLNHALKLPPSAIVVVHRADGSGTTFNLVDYLAKSSPAWRAKVGEGTSVDWPVGEGEPGNEGVARKVETTPGAIGYVEFAFVARHQLTWAGLLNGSGRLINPDVFGFQAAAEGAAFQPDRDFYTLLTDTKGLNAYPIAATTFILLPRRPVDPDKTKAVLRFFRWAFERGRDSALHLGYVPLPHTLVGDVETYWARNFGS